MQYVLALLGMVASYLMIKHREMIGDSIGDAQWMRYVGGVYNLIVLIAVIFFFWSVAVITGTSETFLNPILRIIPFATKQGVPL